MDTKDILYHLRTERDLSQDELAAKIFVTRQAVSRWETANHAERRNAQAAFHVL